MFSMLIRTVILYLFAIVAVRLMGKRQIGEMQPTELVVTFLLSEIAASPMQDTDIPLLNSVMCVLLLSSLSIVTSVLSMHFGKFREAFDGHPAIVINDGKLDQKKMRALRLTMQDLLSSLRQKDVFDIEQVKYAIVETNGTVSVMLKPEFSAVTNADAGVIADSVSLPHLIICDGRILDSALNKAGIDREKLKKYLSQKGLNEKNIMALTYSNNGFGKPIIKEKDKK